MLTPERKAVALAAATVLVPFALFLAYGLDGGGPWYVSYALAVVAILVIGWASSRVQRRVWPHAYRPYDRTLGGLLFALVLVTTGWALVENVGEADWVGAVVWSGLAGLCVRHGLKYGPLKDTRGS